VNGQADLNDLPVRIFGTRDARSGFVGHASVLQMTSKMREEVGRVLSHGDQPLLVGSCCSFLMGAIAGARDVFGRIGLAYIDGHLDLYDGNTSPTGELADTPFAFLMGLAPFELVQAMGTSKPIDARDAGRSRPWPLHRRRYGGDLTDFEFCREIRAATYGGGTRTLLDPSGFRCAE
jgi:arginase family enzyme